MKIYSINSDGSFNQDFYQLLSLGKIINITEQYDFETDTALLEGTIRDCEILS